MRIFKLNESYIVQEAVVYNDRIYECLATLNSASDVPDTSTDWMEHYVTVSGVVVKPFIESISKSIFRTEIIENFTVYGNNFDDTIEIHSDDIPDADLTIMSVTPTEIVVEITTTTTEMVTNFNIYKSGIKNYGLTPPLTITNEILGTGSAGVFLTEFSNNTGTSLWTDWELEIYGAVNSIDGYFASSNGSTPSGSTGPNAGIDSYYGFVETSNPNNGTGNYGIAKTKNFRRITKIEFDYFMNGQDIAGLLVQGYDAGWQTITSLTGEQQASQSDAWLHSSTNIASGYEEIRFVFQATSGYRGDIALDNIKITSI